MATRKWDLLSKEQQTAGLVAPLNATYWGWFDMVNGTFFIAGETDDKPLAMTLPQGLDHGGELERWTAWEFPDGVVRIARPQVLAIVDVEVTYPPELECGCLPHLNGLDWFLIRESDRAMANISRSVDDAIRLTTPAVQ